MRILLPLERWFCHITVETANTSSAPVCQALNTTHLHVVVDFSLWGRCYYYPQRSREVKLVWGHTAGRVGMRSSPGPDRVGMLSSPGRAGPKPLLWTAVLYPPLRRSHLIVLCFLNLRAILTSFDFFSLVFCCRFKFICSVSYTHCFKLAERFTRKIIFLKIFPALSRARVGRNSNMKYA